MSIKTFKHKGAEEVFGTGHSRRIGTQFHKRMVLILDAMNAATRVSDLRAHVDFTLLAEIDLGPSPCPSVEIGD